MNRSVKFSIVTLLVVLGLSACIPGTVPGLRNIHGQTWSARFQVEAQVAGATVRLPVLVSLTFKQRFQEVEADATIEYDAGIFRLSTGSLVELDGRLSFDDHLDLRSSGRTLTVSGYFVGDSFVGTVAIAGVLPVGDVAFSRTR